MRTNSFGTFTIGLLSKCHPPLYTCIKWLITLQFTCCPITIAIIKDDGYPPPASCQSLRPFLKQSSHGTLIFDPGDLKTIEHPHEPRVRLV